MVFGAVRIAKPDSPNTPNLQQNTYDLSQILKSQSAKKV